MSSTATELDGGCIASVRSGSGSGPAWCRPASRESVGIAVVVVVHLHEVRRAPFTAALSDPARMNVPSGRVVKKPVSRNTSRMMPQACASRPHNLDAC